MVIWGSKPRSAMKRRVAATDDGGVKMAEAMKKVAKIGEDLTMEERNLFCWV
ncbi:putative 14-3-3 domain superfamily protein [Helianthus annuus]|nr:putative 14-3-3 domain superfamily protein [Helianthus annuus]